MSTNFVGSSGLPFETHTKVMSMMIMMIMTKMVTVFISTEINRIARKDVDDDRHQITAISKIGQVSTASLLLQVVSLPLAKIMRYLNRGQWTKKFKAHFLYQKEKTGIMFYPAAFPAGAFKQRLSAYDQDIHQKRIIGNLTLDGLWF